MIGRQGGQGGEGDFTVNHIETSAYFLSVDGLWQEQAWPNYSSAFPEARLAGHSRNPAADNVGYARSKHPRLIQVFTHSFGGNSETLVHG